MYYISSLVENDVNENVLQSYFSSTYRRARCTPFYCNLRPSRRSRNNTIPPICSTYQLTKKYSSPASLVYLDLCTRSRFWKAISRAIISREKPSLHFWHGRSGWQTAPDKPAPPSQIDRDRFEEWFVDEFYFEKL